MEKQTYSIQDFEKKAQELISLTFAYCEEELRKSRQLHPKLRAPRDTALAAAALSVQQRIKSFLAVLQIENE